MIETFLAALVVAVCLVLLVRLVLGERRRARLDRVARGAWRGTSARIVGLWRYRSARREAERVAEEAIRRARGQGGQGGEWDGNVFRPDQFKKQKKPPRNEMH